MSPRIAAHIAIDKPFNSVVESVEVVMNPQIRRRVCSSLLWLCTLSVVLLYQPSVWAALGQNDQANRLNLQEMTPTLLPGSTAPLQNIIQLAIGNSHTCALTNRGGVDWVVFNATAGAWYLVEAEPPASSPATLAVEFC